MSGALAPGRRVLSRARISPRDGEILAPVPPTGLMRSADRAEELSA